MTARDGEPTYSRDQLEKILAAAEAEGAPVRADILETQAQLKRLGGVLDQRFGIGSASDLKPLNDLVARLLSLTREPEPELDDEGEGEGTGEGGGEGGGKRSRGSLSGAVTTRAEAIKALDMVCDYLERAEPTNPAQLFLRRAKSLIERNFLELLKELAPDALDSVARNFGIDPETVGQQPE
jgi:type VI secretion system protein ImpA